VPSLGDDFNQRSLSKYLKMTATHALYRRADEHICKGRCLLKGVTAALKTTDWPVTDSVLRVLGDGLRRSLDSSFNYSSE